MVFFVAYAIFMRQIFFCLKQANQQAGKMVAGEPGMKQNYKNP